LPNVGPYIYDVSISGFTRSSIYIYDISSLRVKTPYQQPSPYSQFSLKLCTDRPPRTLIQSDSTICCMCTTVSSRRWALEARNM